MIDEKDFVKKADAAFDDLKKRLLTLGDEHGFDVEGEGGKLEVIFEEPEEVKFVISPNTPIREIWISALSTSFKLGWNESRNAFVLEKTGEDLRGVMSRGSISRSMRPSPNSSTITSRARGRSWKATSGASTPRPRPWRGLRAIRRTGPARPGRIRTHSAWAGPRRTGTRSSRTSSAGSSARCRSPGPAPRPASSWPWGAGRPRRSTWSSNVTGRPGRVWSPTRPPRG